MWEASLLGFYRPAQHPHRAWLYVDDLLAALLRTSAQDSLLILVLLLSSLGAPIKKGLCGRQPHLVRMEVQLCLRDAGAVCSQKGQALRWRLFIAYLTALLEPIILSTLECDLCSSIA